MRSIQRLKAALVQAASDSEWLSVGGKSAEIKRALIKSPSDCISKLQLTSAGWVKVLE
jgi:hypothetical protein